MITILHGDDLAASRNYYLEEKNKAKNPVEFRGENLTLTELKQSAEGGSLFGEEKEIFIEKLLCGRRKSKQLEEILDYLNIESQNLKIVIWEDDELTKAQISSFKKAENKLFKLPQNTFTFLDGIRPNNTQNVFLFQKALKTTPEEILFFMLIRQFRLLLAISDNSEDSIDEVKRLAPWQRQKMERQARLFGEDALRETYKKIHSIDYKTKSGRSALNLVQAIDFLLAEI